MSALIQLRPAEAKEKILAALKRAGAHKGAAAQAIGCSHGTLLRWIADLEMGRAVELLTARALKEGWHHGKNRQSTGRPKGRKDSAPRKRRGSPAAAPPHVNPG